MLGSFIDGIPFAARRTSHAIPADQNRHMLVHATYSDPDGPIKAAMPKLDRIEAITLGHVGQPPLPTLQAALHPLLQAGQAARPEDVEVGRGYRMRRPLRDIAITGNLQETLCG